MDAAPIVEGDRRFRVELDRLVEVAERILEVAPARKGQAPIDVSLRLIRRELDDAVIVLERALIGTLIGVDGTAVGSSALT